MCQGIKRQHPARISVNSDCFCPLLVFTARKRSLRRLCFYTCLSVQRGGGGEYLARYPPGQLPSRQVHPLGRYTSPRHVHPLGRYTHLGRYPPGQVHPRQVHPLGRYTPPGQVHPLGRYTPHNACWDTVNKRAVRIPLECILVV